MYRPKPLTALTVINRPIAHQTEPLTLTVSLNKSVTVPPNTQIEITIIEDRFERRVGFLTELTYTPRQLAAEILKHLNRLRIGYFEYLYSKHEPDRFTIRGFTQHDLVITKALITVPAH